MINTNEMTVKLPSGGILYENIPEEIILRSMTTAEEKILFASSGNKSFHKVLKNCIVEPENINIDDLIFADEHFLILKLRIHTFGSEYHVEGECENCHAKNEYTIDLDDLDVYELDSEFKEPYEIKLPVSGDTIAIKLLRNKDMDFVEKNAKRVAKLSKANPKELEYSMRIAKFIQNINGDDVDFQKALLYADNMNSKDSAYLHYKLNNIKIGYDTTIHVNCAECGEEMEFVMPVNSEFFRPRFE